jgi:ABC-type cobalamin/Fe3+-siderophores transport system ATPase subunit
MGGNKTRLNVINGNINAQTYINNVIAVEALPFIQLRGQNVTFMHDNARPHTAAITRQFLATNSVNILDWPANSLDLNPNKHIWNELGRCVRRNHAIHTVNDIAAALQAEWANKQTCAVYTALCQQHAPPYHNVHCTKWWTHAIPRRQIALNLLSLFVG